MTVGNVKADKLARQASHDPEAGEDALAGSDWERRLSRALEAASPNVLRMSLYHMTRDPSLKTMDFDYIEERGGAYKSVTLKPRDAAAIRARAFDLLKHGPVETPPPPAPEETLDMLRMFSGTELNPREALLCAEELALEEFPREVKWTKKPAQKVLDAFHVAIIGAGISGIAAAIQLKRLGIPFTVYERQSGVGGTWMLNDYPEARVDVSSFTYQYSFFKNYPWPEYYSPAKVNLRYLNEVVDRFGLRDHIRFNTDLTSATWDDADRKWKLGLKSGDTLSDVGVNILISGSGLFSTPNYPDIKGIENFRGQIVHTTDWDHAYDPTGKRAALIGTGSSGTQLAAWVAARAETFTVYQRTPSWFSGISNYRDSVPEDVHWLFDNVPYYWNWFCYTGTQAMLNVQPTQEMDFEWKRAGGLVSEANDNFRKILVKYIETKLEGRQDLIDKCIPSYAPQARRMVVDNGWFDTLKRPNTELVTDGIDHIGPHEIVTRDGVSRPTDFIVLGSGFKVSQYLWPVTYSGRGGKTLEEQWNVDGARSYLGMVMPNFPNMFMLYGPNGQPRTGSFHSWAEVWVRYAATAIVTMLERGSSSIECKQDVFDQYNSELDAECQKIVWEHEGQGGYYVNAFGRTGPNLPWRVDIYHDWTKQADPDDFLFDR